MSTASEHGSSPIGQEADVGKWQPIETAPKGGGAEMVTDPNWVEPPYILVKLPDGTMAVVRWDWYYAEGGHGYIDGNAWTLSVSGEPLASYSLAPTEWMPLPSPTTSTAGR